jgi:hypothetical protein
VKARGEKAGARGGWYLRCVDVSREHVDDKRLSEAIAATSRHITLRSTGSDRPKACCDRQGPSGSARFSFSSASEADALVFGVEVRDLSFHNSMSLVI